MEIQPYSAGLSPVPNGQLIPPGENQRNQQIMDVAKKLEASFLAEMLASAGVGDVPNTFGGGIGEDQFASFMRQEQARQMTEAGGIGLAQALFKVMTERGNA